VQSSTEKARPTYPESAGRRRKKNEAFQIPAQVSSNDGEFAHPCGTLSHRRADPSPTPWLQRLSAQTIPDLPQKSHVKIYAAMMHTNILTNLRYRCFGRDCPVSPRCIQDYSRGWRRRVVLEVLVKEKVVVHVMVDSKRGPYHQQ